MGAELVATGGTLAGGLIQMERVVSPASPQVTGEEITYNSDTSPSFFKFESLQSGSKGLDKMSTTEVLGWLLFGTFLVLLSIPILKFILNVLKVCKNQSSKFTLDTDAPADSMSHDTYKVIYKP